MDESNFGKGAIDRPEDQPDARDYLHAEVAGAMQPAVWVEKKPADFLTLPVTNQAAAYDCVAFMWAKELATINMNLNGRIYRKLSAHSIYPLGFIQGGGMSTRGSVSIVTERGATLEELFPSDNLTEAQAQDGSGYALDAKMIATVYKAHSVVFTDSDFETIASIIHTYRQMGLNIAVGVCVIGKNNGSWMSQFPTPPQSKTEQGLWYHALTVSDFGMINGKKYLSVSNNWGANCGLNGMQFLSEEYQPFMYSAHYVTKESYDSAIGVKPPVHTWSTNLQIGSSGPEVLVMQQALQAMGMFPSNSVMKPTGYFGGITRNGIQMFQGAMGLPVTGIFDVATLERFNSLFGEGSQISAPAIEDHSAGETKP